MERVARGSTVRRSGRLYLSQSPARILRTVCIGADEHHGEAEVKVLRSRASLIDDGRRERGH